MSYVHQILFNNIFSGSGSVRLVFPLRQSAFLFIFPAITCAVFLVRVFSFRGEYISIARGIWFISSIVGSFLVARWLCVRTTTENQWRTIISPVHKYILAWLFSFAHPTEITMTMAENMKRKIHFFRHGCCCCCRYRCNNQHKARYINIHLVYELLYFLVYFTCFFFCVAVKFSKASEIRFTCVSFIYDSKSIQWLHSMFKTNCSNRGCSTNPPGHILNGVRA